MDSINIYCPYCPYRPQACIPSCYWIYYIDVLLLIVPKLAPSYYNPPLDKALLPALDKLLEGLSLGWYESYLFPEGGLL